LFRGRHRLRGLDEAKPLDGIARDVASCQTFKEVKDLFLEHAAWLVERTVRLNNLFGRIHQGFYPTPILSSLFEGPMDKGRDLIDGGATFNSSGVAIIGLADVVDSLAALEQWVFGDREWARQDPASGPVSIPDACSALLEAMQRDFGANGQVDDGKAENAASKRDRWLLATLRNPAKTPKFGNGDAKAEDIARWLVESLDRLYATCDPGGNVQPGMNYRGGRYRVGYWSMTNHAGFGRLSYSTPNGRRKGENFASGITPVSGVTGTLSDALTSVANLPVAAIPNGMAFNIKFPPAGDAYRQQMLSQLRTLVADYFGNLANGRKPGGMEIQFNITSRQDFVEAQQHPDAYPTLLVRVSGYTAYFKDLNSQMQDEIIERTEYGLLPAHIVNIAARPRVE
jgi:pyruvate-formate lyase